MKEEILNKIKEHERIIIHRHVRPDPDALGSQGGLARIIRASFPDKEVYTVGEEDPSLVFLNKMDTIEDFMYEGALVIICDTANSPRISDQRYSLGKRVIKIDHHPNEDPYGDVIWVDTTASSTSEMIMDFYLFGKDKGLMLDAQAARLLYAGIIGDTGRFLFSNTTEKTHRFAAHLLDTGFSPSEIHESLYKISEKLVRLNGYVLQHFSILDDCVGYIHLTAETLKEFNASPSEASLLVNSFAHVEGLLSWVFFVDEPDQIRVRLRSKGPVVNSIAAKFNGGGHPRASGATVYNKSETEDVLKELRNACLEYKSK
ncbi:bifunctional oligoribonuclease/PAP phosphatase NrnA [Fictibacillus nanhaiensis]|uniref:DHH family phosphoesterase n=1 Tax=Fictibacillus nanhaiensis TaxID=742169 RepID=UPI001C98C365|nr:bifunctional oligoribonuclease/PAP phosphatase NrnA [Fictibacillus nanhaiensis]MBY6035200.1 bifunctional oligoribonuclease/PAP phosphatase NrnA [Fictibacillus nanhaiensis]